MKRNPNCFNCGGRTDREGLHYCDNCGEPLCGDCICHRCENENSEPPNHYGGYMVIERPPAPQMVEGADEEGFFQVPMPNNALRSRNSIFVVELP